MTAPRNNEAARNILARWAATTVTVLLLTAPATMAWSADPAAAAVQAARRTELIRLVREDCGSCHGLTLQGGLGPALTPSALRDRDPVVLRDTILFGRLGTPMPPWRPFLTEAEAQWIVTQLQHGFPNEIH